MPLGIPVVPEDQNIMAVSSSSIGPSCIFGIILYSISDPSDESIKSVNKTDAATLISVFSTLEGIVNASIEELTLCPGFGPLKAQKLHKALHESFKTY